MISQRSSHAAAISASTLLTRSGSSNTLSGLSRFRTSVTNSCPPRQRLRSSPHLGQVVPVLKTGLRGDCDFVKRASEAGRGNDRVWKAWKAKKPGFPPFPHSLEIPSGLPHSHGLDCWHISRCKSVVCDIICRRYFVIICRKLFPCGSWRRGQRKPVNVRYRAVSCSNHTLKVGGAAYGRDGSEVCFRTSQRLTVHPRTDATNSGKRSTTNNVTSYS
jgi:hypothetical protein